MTKSPLFFVIDVSLVFFFQNVRSGNVESLTLLLRIFNNLHDCLVQSSPIQSANVQKPLSSTNSKRSAMGPLFMGKRIVDLSSVSALYSPRTSALRRSKRCQSAREAIIRAEKKWRAASAMAKLPRGDDASANSKKVIDHDDTSKSQLASIKKAKVEVNLHRQRLANERRQAQIAVEKAKASIRNKTVNKRHVNAMLKKTISVLQVQSASNRIKMEMAKEKAMDVMMASKICDDMGSSSSQNERKNDTEIRDLLKDLTSTIFC